MSEPIVYTAEQLWALEEEANPRPPPKFRELTPYDHQQVRDMQDLSKCVNRDSSEIRIHVADEADTPQEDGSFFDIVTPTQ